MLLLSYSKDILISSKVWCVFPGVIAIHAIWNWVGMIGYLSITLWALLIYYVKGGVAEALAAGALPRGVK